MSDWSKSQLQLYSELQENTRSLKSWAAIASSIFDDSRFADPVSTPALDELETTLGVKLPANLREFYTESNGLHANCGAWLISTISNVVTENLEMRDRSQFGDLFMPFDNLLIFGGAGNGDAFFFPILADGSVKDEVFLWDHESDSRQWYAQGLKNFLIRHRVNLSD